MGAGCHLRDPQRAVEVGTLVRQGSVFALPEVAVQLDDSLQLLGTLEAGSPGAGIASTWAAVESLLRGPGERGGEIAAKRLAAIITCSWPRAELTPLCFAYRDEHDDALSADLATAGSNRSACVRLENEIRNGTTLACSAASDAAALRRVRRLTIDPAGLGRVQRSIEVVLLRLYRVRNMVMHGGSARSLVTDSLVRSMSSLVGSGIDRIAHGLLVCDPPVPPLELAARATVNVEEAIAGHPMRFSELLEAP